MFASSSSSLCRVRWTILVVDKDGNDEHALRKLATNIDNEMNRASEQYLWNSGIDCLRTRVAKDGRLCGSLDYGDNVLDEWFLAWLMVDVVSSHRHNIVVALSDDGDGQFMLVEAASGAMPAWVRRVNSMRARIWVHRGQVHVVPMPHSPAQLGKLPLALEIDSDSFDERLAVDAVLAGTWTRNEASGAIEQALLARTKGFPRAAIEGTRHRVRLVVTRNVAHAIAERPWLVTRAVDSYFSSSSSRRERLEHCDADRWQPAMVAMTRAHFALLMHDADDSGIDEFAAADERVPRPTSARDAAAVKLGVRLVVGVERLASADDEVRRWLGAPDTGVALPPIVADDDTKWLDTMLDKDNALLNSLDANAFSGLPDNPEAFFGNDDNGSSDNESSNDDDSLFSASDSEFEPLDFDASTFQRAISDLSASIGGNNALLKSLQTKFY
jgi:SGT1 protein